MEFVNNVLSKLRYDSELKEDLYKMATMLAVSKAFKDGHLNSLDNKKFLIETGAVLAGFAVYHLFVKDYAKKVQVGDDNLQKIVNVSIKVGTILAVPKLIKGKDLDLYSGSYVVSGFVANALLKDCLSLAGYFDDIRMKKVADDFLLAAFTTIVPRVVKGGRVTNKLLQEVVAKTIGFAVYDFFLA
jgi:hypothetical protein